MTDVVPIGAHRARRDPEVARALAELAALDDTTANMLGFWRGPDGKLGDAITREEWREGLLAGEVDPAAILRNIALMRFVQSPKFDRALAEKRANGEAQGELPDQSHESSST